MADTLFYALLVSAIFIHLVFKFFLTRKRHRNLPPSPPPLPILGNLHLVKHPVYRTFQKLSEKYGPVFSLRFGSRLVVVISSPPAIHESLTKNDVILANRPRSSRGKHIGYNHTVITSAPYGDHWRNLRRLSSIEIFSASRLNVFLGNRRDEVNRLLTKLSLTSSDRFTKVELRSKFSELTLNIVMRMVAGKRYYGDDVSDEEEANQFRDLMKELMSNGGGSHPTDFLPFFKWFYPNRERKIMDIGSRTDAFLQRLIDQRRKDPRKNNMIDHLLSLQESEPENYSDTIIKGLILVILLAGTDTSAVTLEWGMAHLLNNPEALEKARAELDSKIGNERLVEESDTQKLSYLQGIISETLRLNPAVPLLLPHCASEDCTIAGFDVPKDTIVFFNVWAMHRDPTLWEEALKFKPERHEKEESELQKLMPFGSGRRACPGMGMAQRVVSLTLASLIQCFEWKRVGDKEVDMAEGKGATMPKQVPLEALCKSRPIAQSRLRFLLSPNPIHNLP